MTTKQLESAIFRALSKMGTYMCFEVMMPHGNGLRIGMQNERVDLLSYDTNKVWRFYELKITKSDFYSKCKHTFLGHFNYFVMPMELYEIVKNDIPSHIGAYVAILHEPQNSYNCTCIKKAKRQELKVDEDALKFSFMQSLSREHGKYRRLLEYNNYSTQEVTP